MPSRIDTPAIRKERGAFFTPQGLAGFIVNWAIRSRTDTVLEPSCGDAVFLRMAGQRLRSLGADSVTANLTGHDIHADSLDDASAALAADGLGARLVHGDFFETVPIRSIDAVVGNPPFIRFQGFGGQSRRLAAASAASMGVDLSGLASSWASFVIHGAAFLAPGGRLGLVLPAELMSVNYAAPVRKFLLERFSTVDLIVFDELVFSGVQADVVVLLADGFGLGSAGHFRLHSARNIESIDTSEGRVWKPFSPLDRWTDALFVQDGASLLRSLEDSPFVSLDTWGRASSGIVTGANDFFTMTSQQAAERDLSPKELLPVLPAGTSFVGRAELTRRDWTQTATTRSGYLFAPTDPSRAARNYIAQGEAQGLNLRYKCRIRDPWWKVPIGTAPDLFVSYMSGTTPRIVGNRANVLNLNSVHGLRSPRPLATLARATLPVMAMSSISLLSAELVGRTYGGGILKLEPTEASRWLVPNPDLMRATIRDASELLSRGRHLLARGDVDGCTAIADQILLTTTGTRLSLDALSAIQETRHAMVARRATRGASKITQERK